MEIHSITLPPLRVAAVHQVGPYGLRTKEAFCQLATWAGKNGIFEASSIVVGAYWSNLKVTPPEKCEMDACVTLAPHQNPSLEDGITIKTLPGGLYASTLVNVYNNDFGGAWKTYEEEMVRLKAAFDCENRPCYEFYYGPPADLHPLKKWIVEMIWPIKEPVKA